MNFSKAARTYAESLYVYAVDTNALQNITADAALVSATLAGSRELQKFLANPIIKNADKREAVSGVFGNKVSAEFTRFCDHLSKKGRIDLLLETMSAFQTLRDKNEGVLRVTVECAAPLSAQQETALCAALEKKYAKRIILSHSVNAELIGGFIVRVDDMIIDASMKHQLTGLRKKIAGA
jgi:F-type H+-transporting ATPase subunit delta